MQVKIFHIRLYNIKILANTFECLYSRLIILCLQIENAQNTYTDIQCHSQCHISNQTFIFLPQSETKNLQQCLMAALNANKRIMASHENLSRLEKKKEKRKSTDGGAQITMVEQKRTAELCRSLQNQLRILQIRFIINYNLSTAVCRFGVLFFSKCDKFSCDAIILLLAFIAAIKLCCKFFILHWGKKVNSFLQ